MKRTLTIVIDAGATTCASKPGKFCPWCRVTSFGTKWLCGLFDHAPLKEKDGYLQRLPQCLAAEKK